MTPDLNVRSKLETAADQSDHARRAADRGDQRACLEKVTRAIELLQAVEKIVKEKIRAEDQEGTDELGNRGVDG